MISINQLAEKINGSIEGDSGISISGIGDLTFTCSSLKSRNTQLFLLILKLQA